MRLRMTMLRTASPVRMRLSSLRKAMSITLSPCLGEYLSRPCQGLDFQHSCCQRASPEPNWAPWRSPQESILKQCRWHSSRGDRSCRRLPNQPSRHREADSLHCHLVPRGADRQRPEAVPGSQRCGTGYRLAEAGPPRRQRYDEKRVASHQGFVLCASVCPGCTTR